MQWITWFPGDYLRDTGDLSLIEHGAYRVLLDHYYSTDGRLMAQPMAQLYRICRAMSDEEKAAVDLVVRRFFTVDSENFLKNAKADKVLLDSKEYSRKKSEAGKKGADSRWHSTANGSANGTANGKPNSKPIASTTTYKTKEGDSIPAAIFREGLQILVSAGTPEKEARTFLGMCLSKWADTHVRDALLQAAGKADPLAYARKVLGTKPAKPKPPAGADAVLAKLREQFPNARLASDGKAFFDPSTQNRFSLAGERLSGA